MWNDLASICLSESADSSRRSLGVRYLNAVQCNRQYWELSIRLWVPDLIRVPNSNEAQQANNMGNNINQTVPSSHLPLYSLGP
jgi:hypothetical protein